MKCKYFHRLLSFLLLGRLFALIHFDDNSYSSKIISSKCTSPLHVFIVCIQLVAGLVTIPALVTTSSGLVPSPALRIVTTTADDADLALTPPSSSTTANFVSPRPSLPSLHVSPSPESMSLKVSPPPASTTSAYGAFDQR